MTLAGDIIYEHEALNDLDREELREFLCDAILDSLTAQRRTPCSSA